MIKIRELREARGMTQEELASKIDSTQGCVSRYEREQMGLDLKTAAKIAAALDCTVDDLIEKESA